MLTSILIAAAVIVLAMIFGPSLPGGEMLGGAFYQTMAIIVAVIITAIGFSPIISLYKANAATSRGQHKKAIPLYKKAGMSKNVSSELAIYSGYMLLKEGKTSDAEKVFDKVSKRKLSEKQQNSLNTNLALLKWKQGDIEKGIELLSTVWEKEKTAAAGGSLGALLLLKGDVSAAEKLCSEAYGAYEHDKTIMCNMGEVYLKLGKLDEAEEIFEKMIDLDPDAPAPYYNYALLLIKRGRLSDAEEMLDRALRYRFTALTPITRKDVEKALEQCV